MPQDLDTDDELILEGIVVTHDGAGVANIAPMGPRVDRAQTRLILRPFQSAQTFRNLKVQPAGVFHVTDDVELLARAAVGDFISPPPLAAVEHFPCPRLADACRWMAFRVVEFDEQSERATIHGEVVACGAIRDFFGFNRAKHAVVEAAILATRIGILPDDELRREMARLAIPVGKTAGEQERRAFAFLQQFIDSRLGTIPSRSQ
jgi:hypothetical protein